MFNIEEKIKAWYQKMREKAAADEEEKKKKKNELSDEILKSLGVEVLTDEELKQKAENSVKGKYDVKETALASDLKLKEEKANLATIKDVSKAESKKQEVDEYYKGLNKDAVNDSIKQGISRSSIIDEQIEDNQKSKDLDYKNIDKEIEDIKKSNQDKLNLYQKEYENEMNKLNLEELLEVDSKFETLKEKQDKNIKDATEKFKNQKDNMSVEDKERYYEVLLDKHKNVTIDDINLEYFYSLDEDEKTAIRQNIFDDALKYYYSLSPEEALIKYNNDVKLKAVLGSYTKMFENYLKLHK